MTILLAFFARIAVNDVCSISHLEQLQYVPCINTVQPFEKKTRFMMSGKQRFRKAATKQPAVEVGYGEIRNTFGPEDRRQMNRNFPSGKRIAKFSGRG